MKTFTKYEHAAYAFTFACIAVCFLLSYLIRPVYTPSNAFIHVVLGSSVSFFATLALVFLAVKEKGYKRPFECITYCVLGAIVYEFFQPILKLGYFDWFDVLAILVAGCVAHVLLKYLRKLVERC